MTIWRLSELQLIKIRLNHLVLKSFTFLIEHQFVSTKTCNCMGVYFIYKNFKFHFQIIRRTMYDVKCYTGSKNDNRNTNKAILTLKHSYTVQFLLQELLFILNRVLLIFRLNVWRDNFNYGFILKPTYVLISEQINREFPLAH